MGKLQNLRLIEHTRGKIVVIDRNGLESMSGEAIRSFRRKCADWWAIRGKWRVEAGGKVEQLRIGLTG